MSKSLFLRKRKKKILKRNRFKKRNYFFNPHKIYLNFYFKKDVKQNFKHYLNFLLCFKILFGIERTKIVKKYFKLISKRYKLSFPILFFSLIFRRLDILLYKVGLTRTLLEAKQLISHKKIFLNRKKVNKNNIFLKQGDIITFDSSIYNVLESNFKHNFLKKKKIFLYNNLEISYINYKIVVLYNFFSKNQLFQLNKQYIDFRFLKF